MVRDAAPAASPHLGNAFKDHAPRRLSLPMRPRYGLDRMSIKTAAVTLVDTNRPGDPFRTDPLPYL